MTLVNDLGGEPQILLGGEGVLEAGMGKGADGAVLIVRALQHACALKVVDRLAEGLVACLVGAYEEQNPRSSNPRSG